MWMNEISPFYHNSTHTRGILLKEDQINKVGNKHKKKLCVHGLKVLSVGKYFPYQTSSLTTVSTWNHIFFKIKYPWTALLYLANNQFESLLTKIRCSLVKVGIVIHNTLQEKSKIDKYEYESSYLSCDEWTTGIYWRCDEVHELALVLTVDLTVELCKPMWVGLQSSKGLCMSVMNKTHTVNSAMNKTYLLLLYAV